MNRKDHWESVYETKTSPLVSWYEATPATSLELLQSAGLTSSSHVIDVGGGDSRLVDTLLNRGVAHLTVVDISGHALARSRARLGSRAASVEWIEGDITQVPLRAASFDLWHDRAVFHFLSEPADRTRYVAVAHEALRPEGRLVIGTFAENGPERCSGLPVMRYSAAALAAEFAPHFSLETAASYEHRTPSGAIQPFTFAVLQRRP